MEILNIHGQLVQKEQLVNQSSFQLQLNGKPGIYFIELENERGTSEYESYKEVRL